MSTTRILGAMRCYKDLVEIVRARIAELGITYAAADDLAGLQDGYMAKLLCQPPMRRMTPWTLFLIFSGLGIAVQVFEDKEAMARIAARVERGRTRAPQKRLNAQPAVHLEFAPDLLRINGRKGGYNSRKNLTSAKVKRLARRAAFARWRRSGIAAAN